MLTTRIIPVLHVKNQTLVKGVHLEGLRVLGKPEAFAKLYEQEGADELIFLDLVASLYQRSFQVEVVETVAKQIFIPFTVGGGIRSWQDARALLLAGADKIAVNTAAIKRPELLTEIAEHLGCQSLVLYVEAKKRDGWYECLTDNAREPSGREVVSWCQEAVNRGAGEILLTSVDREGTFQGYDCDLIKRVTNAVNVPVIAHGGVETTHHLIQGLRAGADALGVSGAFHYKCLQEGVETCSAMDQGNTEFLEGRRGKAPVKGMSIKDLKKVLHESGVPVRL